MVLAFISSFTDHAGEVEVLRLSFQSEFFLGLASGTLVWGLTFVLDEFAPGGTPKAPVGRFVALDQQNSIFGIETIDQRGNLHGGQ